MLKIKQMQAINQATYTVRAASLIVRTASLRLCLGPSALHVRL